MKWPDSAEFRARAEFGRHRNDEFGVSARGGVVGADGRDDSPVPRSPLPVGSENVVACRRQRLSLKFLPGRSRPSWALSRRVGRVGL
jgi:hypothetical protein